MQMCFGDLSCGCQQCSHSTCDVLSPAQQSTMAVNKHVESVVHILCIDDVEGACLPWYTYRTPREISLAYPHLPPYLRQGLFVVTVCIHQASWPVSI